MTHVPCPAPGDALLPWAAEGHPQVSALGTPLCRHPRPRGAGEGLGSCVCPAWHQGHGHGLSTGKEESGVLHVPTGRARTGSVPWSLQSCGWVHWLSRRCVLPSARGNLVISLVRKILEAALGSCFAAAPGSMGRVYPARCKPGSNRPGRDLGLVRIGCFGRPAPRQLLGIAGAVQPPGPAAASALPRGPRGVGTRSRDKRRQQIPAVGEERGRVSHAPPAPICCPPGPGLAT